MKSFLGPEILFKKRTLFLLSAFLFFSSHPVFSSPQTPQDFIEDSDEFGPFHKGDVIVSINTSLDEANNDPEISQMGSILDSPGSDYFILRLKGDWKVKRALGILKRHHLIKFAGPNHILKQLNCGLPSDNFYVNGQSSWPLKDINAPAAWQYIPVCPAGSGVTVAVVDSGLNRFHPDLPAGSFINGAFWDINGTRHSDGQGGLIAVVSIRVDSRPPG